MYCEGLAYPRKPQEKLIAYMAMNTRRKTQLNVVLMVLDNAAFVKILDRAVIVVTVRRWRGMNYDDRGIISARRCPRSADSAA